jgi:hypothetical protein
MLCGKSSAGRVSRFYHVGCKKEDSNPLGDAMLVLWHHDGSSEQLEPGVHSDLTKNSVPERMLVGTEEWNKAQAEIRLLTELVKSERNFGDGKELSEFQSKTD